MLLWIGCSAGALKDSDYVAKLTDAGFESIEIEPNRVYNIGVACAFLTDEGVDVHTIGPEIEGKFYPCFCAIEETFPRATLGLNMLQMR